LHWSLEQGRQLSETVALERQAKSLLLQHDWMLRPQAAQKHQATAMVERPV
jgi:hypothetical protein